MTKAHVLACLAVLTVGPAAFAKAAPRQPDRHTARGQAPAPAPVKDVPEPAGFGLLTLAGAAMVLRRKRR